MTRYLFLLSITWLVQVGGCVTAGDVARGGGGEDPSGVKTVEVPSSAPDSVDSSVMSIEELQREIAVLKGKLDESEFLSRQKEQEYIQKIQELEQRQQLAAATPAPAAPNSDAKGGDMLWASARQDLNDKACAKAIPNLTEIGRSYPKNAKAPIAMLALGHCHLLEARPEQALLTYNLLIEKHPKHSAAAQAWYGSGIVLEVQGKKQDAGLFYSELGNLFPKSKEAAMAKARTGAKSKPNTDLFLSFSDWWNKALK